MATSEGRPRAPTRRPETARPRRGAEEGEPRAPDGEELAGIERQLAELAELLGATATQSPELGALLVRWRGRGPPFNHAALVRWSQHDWQERAGALVSRFRQEGEVPALVVAEGLTRPRGLAERLEGMGWSAVARESVLWTRRAAVVPHLDPQLRIEAVTNASIPEYEAVEREIFGVSPFGADDRIAALRASLETARERAYLVTLRGEPVATARLAISGRLAALHGVGVVEHRRRQGFGTLVTTIATRAALAMGSRLVWLSVGDRNEPARRLYASLDYRPAFSWQLLLGPDG